MSKQDEPFRPEQVDEQIEMLSLSPTSDASAASNARLVSELHQVYAEDTEIVEQVWTRLAEHAAHKHGIGAEQTDGYSRFPHTTREDRQKGPHMKQVQPSAQKHRRSTYTRFLEILVASLILMVLVGSMALIFKAKQPSTGHGGSSTTAGQTKTPSAIDETGLYVTTTSGIDRISLQTSRIIWHMPVDYAGQPWIMDGMVFYSYQTAGNNYIGAANVVTGKEIWHKNYGMSQYLQGAHGVLYENSCVVKNIVTGTEDCSIYAIKASNGEQLWSYPTPLGSAWLTVQNGLVYAVSYTQVFALDAATGKPIWQKTLLKYPDQEANMTPVVSGNTMYFASCNATKKSPAFGGCYFFAFNASNGAELWHRAVNSTSISSVVAADGAVYFASAEGTIYVLSAQIQAGTIVRTCNTGGALLVPLVAGQGTLYAQIELASGKAIRLLALVGTACSILWSKDLPDYYPGWPALDNGLIYTIVGQHNVEAFHTTDGSLATSYTDDRGDVTRFTLVTEKVLSSLYIHQP